MAMQPFWSIVAASGLAVILTFALQGWIAAVRLIQEADLIATHLTAIANVSVTPAAQSLSRSIRAYQGARGGKSLRAWRNRYRAASELRDTFQAWQREVARLSAHR